MTVDCSLKCSPRMKPSAQLRPAPTSNCLDSGLVVVVCITASMIAIDIYCLIFVKYEWCHVLFRSNMVGIETLDWLQSCL